MNYIKSIFNVKLYSYAKFKSNKWPFKDIKIVKIIKDIKIKHENNILIDYIPNYYWENPFFVQFSPRKKITTFYFVYLIKYDYIFSFSNVNELKTVLILTSYNSFSPVYEVINSFLYS